MDIAERENRRGRDVAKLDSDVRAATNLLKKLRRTYLKAVAGLPTDDPVRLRLREQYRADRSILRDSRDEAVHSFAARTLDVFSDAFSAGTFSMGLVAGPLASGKATYTSSSEASVLFAAKEAAREVSRLAEKEPQSRNGVVRALKAALDKPYKHSILRLDIAEYFETIPHAKLIDKLDGLDSVSLSVTRTLLKEYASIESKTTGIPRGVGLSSQLGELYLRDLDVETLGQPGVLFYARYVDDVIVVCESEEAQDRVRAKLIAHLNAIGLKENTAKTGGFTTNDQGDYPSGLTLEYLGYAFARRQKLLVTGLTAKRQSRRLARLQISLDAWLATLPNASWPNHGHNGILLNRVRFLAGNIRLANSKSNVAVGLYFSNSALDADADELKQLDGTLSDFISHHGARMPAKLKGRLMQVSFADWFLQKKFHRFSQSQVREIVSVWEPVAR